GRRLVSVADGARQHRVRASSQRCRWSRSRAPCRLCAGLHGAEGFRERLPGPTVWRHAPACMYCPHAGDAAAADSDGRTLRSPGPAD
nr:hypothetical protein [Tanacetum cinerariifolium]